METITITTTTTEAITMATTKNRRVAVIDRFQDRYMVYVGYDDGKVAARYFNGHRDCCNAYKTLAGAKRAARRFLSH